MFPPTLYSLSTRYVLVHRLSRLSTFVYGFTARVRGQERDALEPAENREKHYDVNWVTAVAPVDITEE